MYSRVSTLIVKGARRRPSDSASATTEPSTTPALVCYLDPFAMRGAESAKTLFFVGAAITFAAGAALCYPGGTLLTPSSAGYSLIHNFLSDLGMTVAYNGRPNMPSAILFALSLLMLVFVFGRSVLFFVRQYHAILAARSWAVAAAVLVPLACVAFAGVAVTPENHVMSLHVNVTILAWRVSAIATFLLTMASVHADSQARRRTVAWGMLAVALGAYVLYLDLGPSVTVLDGLRAQVLAQKIIAATTVLTLTYLSVEQHWIPARESSITGT